MMTCRCCGETKTLDHFYNEKNKKHGRKTICKPCDKIRLKEYYINNREKLKTASRLHKQTYTAKHETDIYSRLRNICTKARSRKKKEFNLTVDYLYDLWIKQKGQCAYTKLPMTTSSNQPNLVSLDRIDSKVGYVEGNVQLVCFSVNLMKHDFTEDFFISMCHLVSRNNSVGDNSI